MRGANTFWGVEEFQGVRQKLEEFQEVQQGLKEIRKTIQLTDWEELAKTAQTITPPDHLTMPSIARQSSSHSAVELVKSDSIGTGLTMSSLISDLVDDPTIISLVQNDLSVGPSSNHLFQALDSPTFETMRTLGTMDLSQYEPMFKSLQTGAEVAQDLVQFTEDLEQIRYLVDTGVVSTAGETPSRSTPSQISSTQLEPTVDPEQTPDPFVDLLFSLRRADPRAFDPLVPQQPEPEIDRKLFEIIAEYCTKNKETEFKATVGASAAIALILLLQSGTRLSMSIYYGKFADVFSVLSFYMFVYRDD